MLCCVVFSLFVAGGSLFVVVVRCILCVVRCVLCAGCCACCVVLLPLIASCRLSLLVVSICCVVFDECFVIGMLRNCCWLLVVGCWPLFVGC